MVDGSLWKGPKKYILSQFENLTQNTSLFLKKFYMSMVHFQELYEKLKPILVPKMFSRSHSIRPHEKLALVLE